MWKWLVVIIIFNLIVGAYDLKSSIVSVLTSLVVFSFGATMGTIIKNITKEKGNTE